MNLRHIFAFFRTPVGRLSIFLLLFFIITSGRILQNKSQQTQTHTILKSEGITHATHSRFVREIPRLPLQKSYPKLPAEEPTPSVSLPPIESKLPAFQEVLEQPPPEVLPTPQVLSPIAMEIYAPSFDTEAPFTPITPYLPFGRLLRCELVNTVDTSNMWTPVIGLVTHDIWHDGELVIPAGTEVHGTTAKQSERERVGVDMHWVLVFCDGRELPVSGLALDHAPIPGEESWEVSDGSAGLRGNIIQTDRYAEIKAVTAAMVSAAADGFTDKRQYMTQFGGIVTHRVPGWRAAITSGIERGAQLIAQRLLERGDPCFVRVPAGTMFYLYLTQTVFLHQATIAGSTLSNTEQPQAKPPSRAGRYFSGSSYPES